MSRRGVLYGGTMLVGMVRASVSLIVMVVCKTVVAIVVMRQVLVGCLRTLGKTIVPERVVGR